MKKIFLLILVVFFIGAFAIIPTSQASNQVTNPGTFVNDVSSWAPGSLDPATYNILTTQGSGIIQLTYEGLLKYTNDSLTTFTDSLAYSNYTVSSNGLTYTFWLKPGITFALQSGETVGQPFNAYVMQYSIDRAIIMNDYIDTDISYALDQWIAGGSNVVSYGITSSMASNLTTMNNFLAMQSVKALSTYKMQITLSKPFLGFTQVLQCWFTDAISPKAIIDHEPTTYNTNTADITLGMMPLTNFFPSMSNATILANLGLPSNYNLGNSGVVPNSPANGGANEYTWTLNNTAGTGPWVVTSDIAGSGATLARNNNWWNKASFPSQNAIKTVTWKKISSDSTKISDLKAGSADSIQLGYSNLTQVVNTNTLQSTNSNIQFNAFNGTSYEFMQFDLFPKTSPLLSQSSSSTYSGSGGTNYTRLHMYTWNFPNGTTQMASASNPFTALKFREAFAYAFDYNTYIKSTYDGLAIRMQGVIPAGIFGADQNLISQGYIPTYQPSVAKSLFQQVGWQGTITLPYFTGLNSPLEAVTLLKNEITNLGVNITINTQVVNFQQYVTYSFNGQLPIAQFGWVPDYPDAQNYATAIYANSTNNGFWAVNQNYNNPYVNALLTQATSALTPTSRISLYAQMEQNATQDYPLIYLAQPENYIISNNLIHGLNNISTDSLNGWLIYPNYQWLTKYVTPVSSSTTSAKSSSQTTSSKSTPGFLTISLLVAVVFAIIRKKRRN